MVAGLPAEIHLLRWLAQHGVDHALMAAGGEPGGRCHEIRRLVSSGEVGTFAGLQSIECVPPMTGLASLALSVRDRLVGTGGESASFLLVDAGLLYGFDLAALIRSHATSPAIATLAVRRVSRREARPAGSLRVEMDRSGRILRLARAEVDPTLEFETAGVGLVETDLLRHVDPDRVDVTLEEVFQFVLRNQGVLVGEEVHGPVLELSSPEAVRRAELVLASV